MSHQHATLEDTVYFWFGANDTSGSGNDGASPVYDVRLGGAAVDAIPTLSGSATLLTHANYPAGAHEVAVAATNVNGFAAGNTYGVFCTLLVDSQNPTGFVGSFTLGPVPADAIQISGDATAANNLEAILNGTGIANDVDIQMRSLTITNDAGVGVAITGTTTGLDVTATSGVALDLDGTSYGMRADASAGYGVHVGGTSRGLSIAASAGPGVDIDGTTYGVDIGASAGTGMLVRSTGGSGKGLWILGDNTASGMVVTGGITGHGLHCLGGATSGDGIYAAGQAAGDGMTLVGVGASQYDLNADIHGTIDTVTTCTTATTVTNRVTADMTYIHGSALTETTGGYLAASFTKFHDVATPTATSNSFPDAVAGAAGGLFIAGTNAETTITTALNANIIGAITGSLSGSVGSVTGAVGSVTGAVGSVTGAVGSVAGNVDGSVASVTGAVGSVAGAVGSVTGAVGSVTGAVGSVAGNVDGSVASVAGAVGSVTGAVGSVAAAVTTDGASRTASKADVSALALAATALSTAQWTNARAGYLDELAAANLPADVDAVKAVTVKLDTTMVLDGAVYDFTTEALAAAPSGTGMNAAETRAALGLAAANLDTQFSAIPDAIMARDVSNAEPSAEEHTLRFVVLQMTESNLVDNAGKLTVYQTDGATEVCQKSVTTDASADPITGVS